MATQLGEKGSVRTLDDLHGHYKEPVDLVVLKQTDRLDEYCRQFIAVSPFLVLTTCGPAGVDCSYRTTPGTIEWTISETSPHKPKAGVIFFVPWCPEAFRVRGPRPSLHCELLAKFSEDGRPPKSVIVVHVEEAFLDCGRANRSADSGIQARSWHKSNSQTLLPRSRPT